MTAPEPEERLTALEVKFAFLEEHIVQQDREIYDLRTRLEKQIAELGKLREENLGGGLNVRENERPPHY